MSTLPRLTDLTACAELHALAARPESASLEQLFASDPARASDFTPAALRRAGRR